MMQVISREIVLIDTTRVYLGFLGTSQFSNEENSVYFSLLHCVDRTFEFLFKRSRLWRYSSDSDGCSVPLKVLEAHK